MNKPMTLRCDICSKPLKGERFKIEVLLRPGRFLTVGPECYRKEKKARSEMAPERIEAMRLKLAATAT